MLMADKIMDLRKKNGWSQEELAEKLHVTRQSVSKWEGAQSVPDLSKVVAMAELFGVSTDYLLKDEIESPEYTGEAVSETVLADGQPLRRVSLEEANAYMDTAREAAAGIALGVGLCIVSPIALILLELASETGRISLTGNQAGLLGMVILLGLIAAAVVLFVRDGLKLAPYDYLEKENIDTEYGVRGRVEDEKQRYEPTFRLLLILGILLNTLATVPVLVCAFLDEKNDFLMGLGVALLLTLIACGVYLLVRNGIIRNSFSLLLEEGDYRRVEKNPSVNRVTSIYWAVVTAGYLAYSFMTFDWARSWIVWPVAGVLSIVVREIAKSRAEK